MAPWPTSKVIRSQAFTNTGLDYFGPLYIRQRKDHVKVCVCLFTCITVRAIHLELVEDMTAEQFYQLSVGLLHNVVNLIDKAPNFKATKKTVDIAWEKVVDDPSVHSYLSAKRIKWSFIIEI